MTPWQSFSQGTMEWEFAFRLVISCLCGLIIGLERTRRQKEAGMRTHILVAMGAALIMIVSKYGFFDVLSLGLPMLDVDAARMGSTILTGISFLGAGIILQRGVAVRGLTTAAGVWVTGGVGIAIGAGMYILGLTCAVLTVTVQILLRKVMAHIDDNADNEITITLKDAPDTIGMILDYLAVQGIRVRVSEMQRRDGILTLVLLVSDMDYESIMHTMTAHEDVLSVSL